MSENSKIPKNHWIHPTTVSDNVNSIVEGNNRSYLTFVGGHSATHAEPTQVVRAGENRLVIACSAFAMYCVDLTTGEILWTIHEHKGGDPESDFKQTVYYNGVIYSGVNNISFSAIDPATGKYLWQVSCGKKMSSFCVPFVFKGNKVFVSNEDAVFCIDLDTHKLLWKTPITDKKTIYERNPFLWNDYIVYHAKSSLKKVTPDRFQFLYLHIETGEIERKVDIQSLPDYRVTPIFTEGKLWYIDNEDMLSYYDPETGKETKATLDYPLLKNAGEWEYYYRGRCFYQHESKIYVSLNLEINGKSEFGIYSYDLTTQKLEFRFSLQPSDGNYLLDWVHMGDYLYGKSPTEPKFIHRLSLTDFKVKKIESGLTASMLKDRKYASYGNFAGVCINEGVMYLANRLNINEFTNEEAGYICLTAIW